MYEKAIRRRRIALGLVVALSLGLITLHFGESSGGPLHTMQRGLTRILSPIQDGTSKALKPVRDLFNWTGDTIKAKGERDDLIKERNRLRKQVVGAEQARRENDQLRSLLAINSRIGLENQGPLVTRVIGRSPTVWYSTITIDKGSSDGIEVNQPVISGSGLIGRISVVNSGSAQVTLITDHESAVSVEVNVSGARGLIRPVVGNPSELLLDFISRGDKLKRGQHIVTSGSRSSRLESLYPPGIPVGWVSKIDQGELDLYQRAHVKAFADLRRIDFVEVLTKPDTKPEAEVLP